MKFEVTKKGKLVSLLMHYEAEPKRCRHIMMSRRVFITSKAPKNEDELLKSINLHLANGTISSANEFHDKYHKSMQDTIENEAREIVKSYLRIQEAIKCIDLSDSIRLSKPQENYEY